MTPNEPKIRKLTKAEKEVLELITEQFLTPKQVQIRRQCSRQAVYKIISSLKRKGALSLTLKKVDKTEAPVNQIPNSVNQIRLHGQEFNIKILFQSGKYSKLLKGSNLLHLGAHTVKLYRNAVEIYSGEGTSFYGDTAQEALSKSLIYWKKFISRLENELKVILLKPRSRNIRVVNQHFARGNSEIAYNATENKKRIKVFAEEDGKLAFITDDSFGFMEDETVHPQTSKPDREAIDKHVNDWRLRNPLTNSEIQGLVYQNAQNLDNYAKHLSAHVESVKELGSSVKDLTKIIKRLEKKRNL